jgi:WD40 repeat protein
LGKNKGGDNGWGVQKQQMGRGSPATTDCGGLGAATVDAAAAPASSCQTTGGAKQSYAVVFLQPMDDFMKMGFRGKLIVVLLIAAAVVSSLYFAWVASSVEVPRLVLKGSQSAFHQVTFSADGLLVAAGQPDGTVTIWEVAAGKEWCTFSWKRNESVEAMAFSPNGQTLAWGGWVQVVELFDTTTKEVVGRLEGHERQITAIAFNPKRATMATATSGGVVRVWDLETNKASIVFKVEKNNLTGYQPKVETIAFDPTGQTLAVSSERDVY